MVYFNPSFDRRASFSRPGQSALEFHKRLPSYVQTPLVSLSQFANKIGVENVCIKDESDRIGLPAFKILGASWATYLELSKRVPGANDEWRSVDELKLALEKEDTMTLYSATDGNHGRAVARAAKMFGVCACIYVPQQTVSGRIAAIESEGAGVTIVEGTYDDAVARAARDAESNKGILIQDNGWKGYEEIPRHIVAGYSTMLWEIDEQLLAMNQTQPTHVVVQLGNGSFAEAVVRHYCATNSPPLIIGVEPATAASVLESVRAGRRIKVPGPHTSIMVGMNCDSPSLVSFPVMQQGVTCFIAMTDERAREAMRLLAGYNIVSGETGAAGMGALLEILSPENHSTRELLHFDSRSRVLIFSTEGSTDPASYKRIISEKAKPDGIGV